jgi:CMP-N-acetylneuraminic acid synthetase
MNNLAVIPARGGSSRLKDKNILSLEGKPLIFWTIDAVKYSGCFDSIVVSSDSDTILNMVEREYRTTVSLHKRPIEFATRRVPVLDAMLNILDEIENIDTFSYFLPTCPFRNKKHVKEGFDLLSDSVDSVISVVEYSEPIQLAGKIENDFFTPFFSNLQENKTNSLFMDKYYKPNGGFYMANVPYLREKRNFFAGKTKGYIMDKVHSIDINDEKDMLVAEVFSKKSF